MRRIFIPSWLPRFLRRQQLYIAIAVAVYAVFWAVGPEKANAIATLIYSLCLCNMGALLWESLARYTCGRGAAISWAGYIVLLFAATPVMVAIATVPVYWLVAPPQSAFWPYLATGWKFPSVATVIFGIVFHIYHTTKSHLERSNRELQRTVELEAAQRELQDQELARAREIQMTLLPKEIPQVAGFEIAGVWEPARTVGGDYFDVIRLSESKLGICIADVVGKSVSAALLMANVQATVRAFASESASPSWLCSRVNAVLCNNIAAGKFVTLFYGVLDAPRRTFEYANAGHLRPILISSRESLRQLDDNGALLGVFPAWRYEDSVVQLAPGDRLLLFTDGITEAMSAENEEFGERRLAELARHLVKERPGELKARIVADVKTFCNSQLQDDATLVVIGALGAQTEPAKVEAEPRLAGSVHPFSPFDR
jgi:sigma-B regulation protein RsbU (phosphoserine phosphatase)